MLDVAMAFKHVLSQAGLRHRPMESISEGTYHGIFPVRRCDGLCLHAPV